MHNYKAIMVIFFPHSYKQQTRWDKAGKYTEQVTVFFHSITICLFIHFALYNTRGHEKYVWDSSNKSQNAWKRGDPKSDPLPTKLQPGDTVLVQSHTEGPFDPKYLGDYYVVSLKGNQVEVQLSIRGPMEMKHIKHVKYILPTDWYIKQVPDYSAFGRKTTLRMNPDKISELQWQLASTYHTSNVGQLRSQASDIYTHGIDVDTISHAGGNKYKSSCGTTLNTDTIILQSHNYPITYFDIPIGNKI